MTDPVLDTLFTAFETCLENDAAQDLRERKADFRLFFIGAQYSSRLENFRSPNFLLQQYFKPFAQELEQRGFSLSDFEGAPGRTQDCVLVNCPKNIVETRCWIAHALRLLRPGGILICAGDNKAGGTRIKKIVQQFGVSKVTELSKNKARAVICASGNLKQNEIESALLAGAVHRHTAHGFLTQPGLFGWDKIDKGSQILLRSLPGMLQGSGADFGCGYGFLSDHIVRHIKGVRAMICIDADARAVAACRENISGLNPDIALRFDWRDLTQPCPDLAGLDWIVMNPPFHEGKKTDASIGCAFIRSAAQSLRPGGILWMVANAGLPYEAALAQRFSEVKKCTEENGFKVFCCTK